ncbi:3'-5' exonuclease [Escherichia coli]
MKICSRCHQQKEERDFQIRRASRDGLTAACRACLAEYDKERAGLPHRVSARREYQSSDDCVILRNSYSLTGQPVPWQWWNDRDVRTIVELGKVIGFDPKRDMPFKGTRHNALDDAIHQAKYVSAIWKKLAK